MSNLLTIMRRDLLAYFTSPIGYVYMIVFVLISVGLYITTFFTFPVADMRPFFGNLPMLFCVFIPAVTMRIWAEERKENTWEMLLTFPMKAWQLVIGKFLAAFIFVAIAIAVTFTVPWMLASLGNPDNGALFAGYLGTLLVAAFFLSIGILFSGFFNDQILAFVVTLLVAFAIFMVGTNFVAAYIDGVQAGLGSLLSTLVGLSDHYNAFMRGVIEVADILYFVAWTAIFLLLNILFIDGRSRSGARVVFGAAVVICVAIGLLFNFLMSGASLARFDLTEDKIYTVSDASTKILSNLSAPVHVNLYITPKNEMPTQMQSLEQDVTSKLEEFRVASGGTFDYSVVHLRVANAIKAAQEVADDKSEEEKDLEGRMLDKGVEPFPVQAMSEDQITNKVIYSSLGIAYKDQAEEIIPEVMPQILPELEYTLVSKIYKVAQDEQPIVAMVAPQQAINIPPEMRRLYEQIGQPVPQTDDPYEFLQQALEFEKYNVKRVELTQDSGLPEDYDTLVVINPRNFNERQRWEINRALHSGKSVVLAVQTYEWQYVPTAEGISINSRAENPSLNPLLTEYGLEVDEDILMDVNHVPLTIQTSSNPLASMMGMGQTINLPMHILVNNTSMHQDVSITNRLSSVFYLWGTALKLDNDKLAEAGIEADVLMTTTDEAWTVSREQALTAEAFEKPAGAGQEYPLMVLARGQFPDAFADQERPAWPPPQPQPGQFQPPPPPVDEPPPGEIESAPGQLILLGSSEMFRRDFLRSGNHIDLFLNSVDALTLGDDLVNVRGRKPIDRVIDMPSSAVRTRWKAINYGLAPVAIALIGAAVMFARRSARNRYTMSFVTQES